LRFQQQKARVQKEKLSIAGKNRASLSLAQAMPARKFRSEGPVLYDRYQSGYGEWAETGDANDLEEVYTEGYLPYSGDPGDPRHLFYMARSLRVALDRFATDKKRRYDHRQWENHGLGRQLMAKEDFLEKYGPGTAGLAKDWMEKRFGAAFLSGEKYAYILSKPYLRDILAWTLNGELVAFALVVRGDWGAHYWYVFYRNGGKAALPSGHGYLVDFLFWARESRIPYAYLGTSYGEKSRYKSRGIDGIEFWAGNAWSPDRDELNRLPAADDA
jgi:hypothetical protein